MVPPSVVRVLPAVAGSAEELNIALLVVVRVVVFVIASNVLAGSAVLAQLTVCRVESTSFKVPLAHRVALLPVSSHFNPF